MTALPLMGVLPDRGWQLRTVYQPILDLDRATVIGAEALTRDRTGLRSITSMLEQARQDRTVAQLDRLCQRSAVQSWLAASLPTPLALFMNVEPSVVIADPEPFSDSHLDALQDSGTRVVIEITEREVLRDPHALLRFREQVRERGWELAVDDIGVDASSLAMLPILSPDVMKLDMQLLHQAPGAATARTINAVLAEAERSGGTVLAEGIETQAHLDLAVSAGATLGQGWLFGRPSDQLPPKSTHQPVVPLLPAQYSDTVGRATTPWQLIGGRPSVRRARKPLLSAVSNHIELQIDTAEPATIVLGAFQDEQHLRAEVLRRYSTLAEKAAFVGVLGVEVSSRPAPGVRGCALRPDDPLVDEWTVVVISPYFAAALVAHDTHEPATDEADRQFDYLLTYDRDLIITIARTIMDRFTGD